MIQFPWGVPGRAYLTVPPEVEIVPSKMPNAGLGVISKTFVPKYAWLGEYEGLTVLPHENQISAYAWSVSVMTVMILYQSVVADLHRQILEVPSPSIYFLFSWSICENLPYKKVVAPPLLVGATLLDVILVQW